MQPASKLLRIHLNLVFADGRSQQMKNHNLRNCGHSLLCIDSIPLEKYSLALMRWTICIVTGVRPCLVWLFYSEDFVGIRTGQVMAEIAVSKETIKIFSSFVKLLNSHSPLFFFKVAKWKPPFFSWNLIFWLLTQIPCLHCAFVFGGPPLISADICFEQEFELYSKLSCI